jgi:class 3 adenylate cyclase
MASTFRASSRRVGRRHGSPTRVAYVGDVGSSEVKDFTAIGDVVNTAARAQAAVAGGEIIMATRMRDRARELAAGAEPRELSLKGRARARARWYVGPISLHQLPT